MSEISSGVEEEMYQLKTMCLAKRTVQMPNKDEHGFLLFCGLGNNDLKKIFFAYLGVASKKCFFNKFKILQYISVDLIKRIKAQKDGGKVIISQKGFPMWHAIPRSLCRFKAL